MAFLSHPCRWRLLVTYLLVVTFSTTSASSSSNNPIPKKRTIKQLASPRTETRSTSRLVDVIGNRRNRNQKQRMLSNDHDSQDDSVCTNPKYKLYGKDITGIYNEYPYDTFGEVVALSADGQVLVISSPNPQPGTSYSYEDDTPREHTWIGYIRTYQKDETSSIGWVPLGKDIEGGDTVEFGRSLAISDDGQVLAVAGYTWDDEQDQVNRTFVRVYERKAFGIEWEQIGQDLYGDDGEYSQFNRDNFGGSIALSGDGSVLAIGASEYRGTNTQSGMVRVYQRNDSTSLGFSQVGNDIYGVDAWNYCGCTLAMSQSGNMLAFSCRATIVQDDGDTAIWKGYVQLYGRDPVPDVGWVQLGQNLEGNLEHDMFGASVSLSSNGGIVAISGGRYDDQNRYVKIYQRDFDTAVGWSQVGLDLKSETTYFDMHHFVQLSGDGTILALGMTIDNEAKDAWKHPYLGQVKVLRRDAYSKLGWLQVGKDLIYTNDYNGDVSALSMSLSKDGSSLAVGKFDPSTVRVHQVKCTSSRKVSTVALALTITAIVLSTVAIAISFYTLYQMRKRSKEASESSIEDTVVKESVL